MRPLRDRLRVAALAMLLNVLTGSNFSVGAFTVSVEAHASPRSALDGAWPAAMGLMSFLAAAVTIAAGVFVDAAAPASAPGPARAAAAPRLSVSARLRALVLVGALGFAALALAGLGARLSSRSLVWLGVAMQALPLGAYYIVVVELLMTCFPNNGGLAIALSQTAFGAGQIASSRVFQLLITRFGTPNSIYVSSLLLTVPAVLASTVVYWPGPEPSASLERAEPETHPLEEADGSAKVPWHQLFRTAPFWLYMAIICASCAPYAVMPYFFKVGHLFHQPDGTVVSAYQFACLMGTIVATAATYWTDYLAFGNKFWSSGPKNLQLMIMAVQPVLFVLTARVSTDGNFAGYVALATALIVAYYAQTCCIPLMARDFFGVANRAIVVGIGGGLALGAGEGGATAAMRVVEAMSARSESPSPSSYNPFYIFGAFWSIGGLLCIVGLSKLQAAFIGEKRKLLPNQEI